MPRKAKKTRSASRLPWTQARAVVEVAVMVAATAADEAAMAAGE